MPFMVQEAASVPARFAAHRAVVPFSAVTNTVPVGVMPPLGLAVTVRAVLPS